MCAAPVCVCVGGEAFTRSAHSHTTHSGGCSTSWEGTHGGGLHRLLPKLNILQGEEESSQLSEQGKDVHTVHTNHVLAHMNISTLRLSLISTYPPHHTPHPHTITHTHSHTTPLHFTPITPHTPTRPLYITPHTPPQPHTIPLHIHSHHTTHSSTLSHTRTLTRTGGNWWKWGMEEMLAQY